VPVKSSSLAARQSPYGRQTGSWSESGFSGNLKTLNRLPKRTLAGEAHQADEPAY